MNRDAVIRQRGMTMLGMLLTLVILIAVATVTIKLVPVYLEDFTVTTVLKSLKDDPDIAASSDHEIRESVSKRFEINNVEHVKASQVQIARRDGRVQKVSLDYQVRVPMFWNIDALVHFADSVEVGH